MASRMLHEIPKRAKNMILASCRMSGCCVLVLQDPDGVARPTYKDSQPLQIVLNSCFDFKNHNHSNHSRNNLHNKFWGNTGYSFWPKDVRNFSSNPPCKGHQYQLHLAETLVQNFPRPYSKWVLSRSRPAPQRQPALERKASGMHQGGQD